MCFLFVSVWRVMHTLHTQEHEADLLRFSKKRPMALILLCLCTRSHPRSLTPTLTHTHALSTSLDRSLPFFLQFAGLLYFNAHDVGISEGLKTIWAL